MTQNLMEEVTEAMDEAQWRVYQRQAMKRVKDGLLAVAKKQGSGKAELTLAQKFLDSKIGEGLLCAAIGFGGSRVPMLGDNPKFARLMKEFRVEGVAVVGDNIIEKAMEMLMPAFTSAITDGLESLPEVRIEEKPKKKARIKVSSDEDAEHEHKVVEEVIKDKKQLRSIK